MNEVSIIFDKCFFKDNKAEKHGGAIAIQTLKEVEITYCIFESYKAFYNFGLSSELLDYDTHYYKRIEGRGSAIYINPYPYTFKSNESSCYDKNLFMNPVTIKNCSFKSYSARDGHAIYIEGDDPSTIFNIESNKFTDNYNFGSDENSDPNIAIRGAIATEIHSVPESIVKTNEFVNVRSKKLVYVDHYGNRITKEFTESEDFSYSEKFTKSEDFSIFAKFTESNDFIYSSKSSKSAEFLPSDQFTNSKEFSNSDKFIKSYYFSKSEKFTETQEFSLSS